jgi:hypothetical protein
LRDGRFLVIFKIEASEELVSEIVAKINNSNLIIDSYADKVTDSILPGVWWIRQSSPNRRKAAEVADNIEIIINSFRR